MNYRIRGENIPVTEAIREYTEKKIGRLERYLENSSEAVVYINLKVNPNKSAKVEVTIRVNGLVLRAEESNSDMYASIDIVSEKLERQIRKHKTKVNRKYREKGVSHLFTSVDSNGHNEEEDLTIVRKKRFDLKPMDAEEAVLQMNLLGHNFYIFTDAEENETNIVYQRNDGSYGLIQVS